MGYSPRGREESDMTERPHFHLLFYKVDTVLILLDFTFTLHFHALEKEMANHSSVLALRIPVGCHLWGGTESDTTEAT